jgi:hypothetical protein
VAGCCECGDEPSGSCATELVNISFSHLNMTDNCMRLVSESNNPFVGLMEEQEEDSDNGYEQIVNFLCEYWQQFHAMLT